MRHGARQGRPKRLDNSPSLTGIFAAFRQIAARQFQVNGQKAPLFKRGGKISAQLPVSIGEKVNHRCAFGNR